MCSKVLSLASPVFAALFKPHFSEGCSVLRGECPVIELIDDEAIPMEIILRILHHQHNGFPFQVDAKLISVIAIHCDKYNCLRALRPWTTQWLSQARAEERDPVEIGLLLLAAYKLDSSTQFASLSAKCITDLKPDLSSWDAHANFELLPSCLRGIVELHTNPRTR